MESKGPDDTLRMRRVISLLILRMFEGTCLLIRPIYAILCMQWFYLNDGAMNSRALESQRIKKEIDNCAANCPNGMLMEMWVASR